jgi:hypothetical protein
MKLKSVRCGICDSWNGAYRNHCYVCGATRSINNRHYNYAELMQGRMLEMRRGVTFGSALRHLSRTAAQNA